MTNPKATQYKDRLIMQHRIRELQKAVAQGAVIDHNGAYLSTQTVQELAQDGYKLADSSTEGAQTQYVEDWRGNLKQVYLVAAKPAAEAEAETQPIIVASTLQAAPDRQPAPAQSQKPATKTQPQPAVFQAAAPA